MIPNGWGTNLGMAWNISDLIGLTSKGTHRLSFLGKSFRLELNSSESDQFRAIPKSVSEPFGIIPNLSDRVSFDGNWQKPI